MPPLDMDADDGGAASVAPSDALQFVISLSGRRFVLFLVVAALEAAGEPPTGPALRAQYNALVDDDQDLSDGAFYPALGAMVQAGVVEERPASGRAAHWHVTDQGWTQLAAGADWVQTILDASDQP